MILFLNDYNLYKKAIIDTNTKNVSFLKIAHLYKKMGIKNWAFPLILHQKELSGVDPFANDLDQDIIIKIVLESKYNPWYAFREIIRIPVQGSIEPSFFIANRANMALLWCFFNHIDFLLIQPRQTYKSGSVDSLMIYLLFIATENLKINLITKSIDLRQENIERLKGIRDYLPFYFYRENNIDVDNKMGLTNHSLNNVYKTSVAQRSVSGANKVGRGMAAPIFHFDEVPFISNIGITLPAALAAGTAARDQAKLSNGYYGNIFTTTAGERGDRDGAFVYKMMDNATVWSEAFYDCKNILDLINVIKSNRKVNDPYFNSLLINGTFSHRQLGRTDDWLKDAIANTRGDRESIRRDFLNIWTSGSTYSPLSEDLNNKIFNSEIEPTYTDIKDSYVLRWYCSRLEVDSYLNSNRFVLGLDTSEAIGRDAIGMVLTDVSDLRTVMCSNISETNLLLFAHRLADFLIKYENIVLIPEMRSSARVIIDALLVDFLANNIDPFKRIYNQLYDNEEKYLKYSKDLNKLAYKKDSHFINQHRKEFGFVTNEERRSVLFGSNFQLAATRGGHLVYDKVLSKEIRGLVVKDGRIDHKSSGHDDVCVAWLLNHWFLTNGRNLNKYGIETGKALAMVSEEGEVVSIEDMKKMKDQAAIREQIDKLVIELSKSNHPTLTTKLTLDLKRLSGNIEDSDKAIYNFEDLLRKANELKIKRRKDKDFKNNKYKWQKYNPFVIK